MCSVATPRRNETQSIVQVAEIARSIRIRDARRETDQMRWLVGSLEDEPLAQRIEALPASLGLLCPRRGRGRRSDYAA